MNELANSHADPVYIWVDPSKGKDFRGPERCRAVWDRPWA